MFARVVQQIPGRAVFVVSDPDGEVVRDPTAGEQAVDAVGRGMFAKMIADAKALANVVQKAMGKQGKFYFDHLPKENHGTILHGAVMQAFTQLYEKN